MRSYHKEWFSGIILTVFIITEAAIFLAAFFSAIQAIHILFAAVAFVVYIIFFSLTVAVENDFISIKFGLGLFSNIYPISTIEGSFVGENDKILSWIYNPRGKASVRLRLRNGTVIALPSEEELELAAILRSRR